MSCRGHHSLSAAGFIVPGPRAATVLVAASRRNGGQDGTLTGQHKGGGSCHLRHTLEGCAVRCEARRPRGMRNIAHLLDFALTLLSRRRR